MYAINKMDLVSYKQDRYDKVCKQIKKLTAEYAFQSYIIPVSATAGDNITSPSKHMPWYKGDTLLHYLETVDVQMEEAQKWLCNAGAEGVSSQQGFSWGSQGRSRLESYL